MMEVVGLVSFLSIPRFFSPFTTSSYTADTIHVRDSYLEDCAKKRDSGVVQVCRSLTLSGVLAIVMQVKR